jgi:Protein of unknown function (DUF2490)
MATRGRFQAAVPMWALCALLPCAAHGQPAKQIHAQYQSWGSLNSTTRLTDRLGVIADFHVRRNDFLADPSFYFVRLGANAWVSERLTLSLGYAHLWKAPGCDGCETWAGENRIYQQVQYATAIGKTRVVHRLRNEQRWQETVKDDVRTGERSLSNRVRYLVSFTIPVSTRPEIPSLVLSDEVALQFGRDIVANTFDQNRLFTGIKQRLGREWSFDLGYMLVYQQKANGYQYDLNHTLRWFVYFTPDLRRVRGAHHPAAGEERARS